MQITETHSQGLKRELKVVIGAKELQDRMEARLETIKDKVHLKGFRPGKVPIAHIRKTYGRSIMAEVVQQAVSEVTAEALKERDERPAFQPEIKLPEDTAEVEKVMSGEGDLEYTMSFEVLPKIDLKDLKSLRLEKEVAEVDAEAVNKSLEQLREANVTYAPKDGPADNGDQLTIDFIGFIDGEAFEGGSAEDATVVLGQGRFIPGFEEGLAGVKAGDTPVVKVTFPEDYGAAHLAGKEAEFNVTVKEVGAPVLPELNDEFAKSLGLESLEKLREALNARIAREYDSVSRTKLKKALLDALDEQYSFELPPTLVEGEFNAIWSEIQQQLQRSNKTFEDEGTSEEKARAEYQKLAERRVRLGLLLSEIGQRNEIKISDDDVKRAILERARQFPGQESRVVEFYKKNPDAVAQLRAPIYEEKVVRFILELADVTEKRVSPAELLQTAHDHEHDHDHVCGPDCDHDHHHHDHHDHEHHHHEHEGESGKAKAKKSRK